MPVEGKLFTDFKLQFIVPSYTLTLASPYGVLQSAANQNRSIAGGNRTIVHLVAEHCEAGEGFFVPSQSKIKDF